MDPSVTVPGSAGAVAASGLRDLLPGAFCLRSRIALSPALKDGRRVGGLRVQRGPGPIPFSWLAHLSMGFTWVKGCVRRSMRARKRRSEFQRSG